MEKIELKRVPRIVRLEGVKLTPAEVALEELNRQELAENKEKQLTEMDLKKYKLNK